jgi:primase-polymerase (primpol)-like protein
MFQNVPNEMRAYPNFIVWKFDQRADGRITKIPYQVRNGHKASVIDPTQWSSFEAAIAVAHNYDGIGFVFSEHDPYAGIDLDDTHGDAIAIERQKDIFRQFDSYSEISPSGKGLHIIVRGGIPSSRHDDVVEVYSSGRYFTMTGNVYNAKPIADRQTELNELWAQLGGGKLPSWSLPLNVYSDETDQSIIDRAFNAENGGKFGALWNGDGSVLDGADRSGSAIDQALVNIIQFYTKSA